MKRLRCAIYTRKSTSQGLEREFNSLDAQREACEQYVASLLFHELAHQVAYARDDTGFNEKVHELRGEIAEARVAA